MFSEWTGDTILAADVPALAAAGVQAIVLRHVPVRNIAALSELTGLQALDLSATQVRDLAPLAALRSLRSLDLRFLMISDIGPLAGLTDLQTLALSGTDVSDLSPLRALTRLRSLSLAVTRVSDLSPLNGLRHLVILDLASTSVRDLTPIAATHGLAVLNLNGTPVDDIQPLSHLGLLERLDLGGTAVSDLHPLSSLTRLGWLNIQDIPATDLSPLVGLRKLQFVALAGSGIKNSEPLTRNGVRTDAVAFAAADPVLFWNERTNRAIQGSGSDAFVASRVLALESIAVLDTIRSIREQPGFAARLPVPGDIPPEVAVSGAAYGILMHLFPDQQVELNAALNFALRNQPDGPLRRTALAFGHAMANAVIDTRQNDGVDEAWTADRGADIGEWLPTPPAYLPPGHPNWKSLRPFGLLSPSQFRPAGPPPRDSAAYRTALDSVRDLGSMQSATRTKQQTQIALYWSDALGTYAPAGRWNAIAAEVVRSSNFSEAKEATLLAELNVAIADSVIAMADAKYTYWSARPVTAIHDGGPGWQADPAWLPLLETPNHPSYVSGHSAISGAATAVLAAWFGDEPFSFTSDAAPGAARHFASFSQAEAEAAASRVYGGIQFPFDNADGMAIGHRVGEWTLRLFAKGSRDQGPVLMVMGNTQPSGTAVEGCALDNVRPLSSVLVRVDGGPPFGVRVDGRGMFSLPERARGHRIALSAVSATGLTGRLSLRLPPD